MDFNIDSYLLLNWKNVRLILRRKVIHKILQRLHYSISTLATYFICIGFGAVGNLITLFTMATADRKNKSGTNVFLISLTVSFTNPLKP